MGSTPNFSLEAARFGCSGVAYHARSEPFRATCYLRIRGNAAGPSISALWRECPNVQEEPDQNERIRKVRVEVDDLKRRALIRMADARDLQEQMRKITMRLGSSIMKVGEGELDGEKSE